MSEGTGGVSRPRTWLYARLEEMSFRSGATVAVAVLVLVAVAITLAVMPGGHRADSAARGRSSPGPGLPGTRSAGVGSLAGPAHVVGQRSRRERRAGP